jgi:hypothetical protein
MEGGTAPAQRNGLSNDYQPRLKTGYKDAVDKCNKAT